MEIKSKCSFVKYEDMEFGLKDSVCFIFEFNVGDNVVQELAQDFFLGLIAEIRPINQLNQLLGLNADYYQNFSFSYPSMKIISDFEFRLISKRFFLNGQISEQSLKMFGFNNLMELEKEKFLYRVLFTTDKDLTANYKKIYISSIYSIEKEL